MTISYFSSQTFQLHHLRKERKRKNTAIPIWLQCPFYFVTKSNEKVPKGNKHVYTKVIYRSVISPFWRVSPVLNYLQTGCVTAGWLIISLYKITGFCWYEKCQEQIAHAIKKKKKLPGQPTFNEKRITRLVLLVPIPLSVFVKPSF